MDSIFSVGSLSLLPSQITLSNGENTFHIVSVGNIALLYADHQIKTLHCHKNKTKKAKPQK